MFYSILPKNHNYFIVAPNDRYVFIVIIINQKLWFFFIVYFIIKYFFNVYERLQRFCEIKICKYGRQLYFFVLKTGGRAIKSCPIE